MFYNSLKLLSHDVKRLTKLFYLFLYFIFKCRPRGTLHTSTVFTVYLFSYSQTSKSISGLFSHDTDCNDTDANNESEQTMPYNLILLYPLQLSVNVFLSAVVLLLLIPKSVTTKANQSFHPKAHLIHLYIQWRLYMYKSGGAQKTQMSIYKLLQ